jgi:hypothetical protein
VTSPRDEEPDIAYFRDIERAFVERRGDPLFISNADWVLLARLRKRGVPRRVVLRGIADAFDAHAHSFSRKQKIRSLKFCETEIKAAADRYRRALRADGPSRRGLGAAIGKLESQLAGLETLKDIEEAVAEARQGLLVATASAEADQDYDAEKALARIEDRLVEGVCLALDPRDISAIESSTRDATAAYRPRMPAKVYETLIGESVRRKILQRFGLPRFLLADLE